MAEVYKKDEAGIRRLLKSQDCLSAVEKYAHSYANGDEIIPFIGFDRAKCFIKKKRKQKWSK